MRMGSVDRRGFFRSLAGEALRSVAAPAPAREVEPVEEPPPAALPAQRCVTAAELAELAGECGLEARLDEVRSLARTSVRLTPATELRGRSHVGGSPDLPAADRPPGYFHVLQLDLDEVARVAGGGLGLPAEGMLWCFRDGGDIRCVVRAESAPTASDRARTPVGLSAEMVLPRIWAAPVQALGLSAPEADGWEAMRDRLAALQGVEPPDATPQHVMRVLGYPEDRRGDMPLRCELRFRGHEIGDDPPAVHPAAPECEPASARWRLLLQLPAGSGERLFAWVPEEQLSSGDLAGTLAIVR
jgi:hypothetical protein